MKVTSEEPLAYTDYGWAAISLTPPSRRDLMWMKMPEKHIYTFDGDGWFRIDPPEMVFIPDGDLNHG